MARTEKNHLGQRRQTVLVISSGGGHWVQLNRLAPSFEGCRVLAATVDAAYQRDMSFKPARFFVVRDATRWNKFGLLVLALQILRILLWERPNTIVSTGAAPGYLALRFGKFLGCRTIWVDSIANVERMSLSGERIRPYADLWLTQWPHLAKPGGPIHAGAVL